MPASYRFVVSGRVQGVGFRYSAMAKARALGLNGWVRNRDDGSVEGVAGGAVEALQQLRAWLQQGPPAAKVERVEWSEEAGDIAGEGFSVRR